jgi:hypothetical protein
MLLIVMAILYAIMAYMIWPNNRKASAFCMGVALACAGFASVI